jgi:site-specific DNA-adenine methylase
VSCILSNSDTEIIRNLYDGFEIIPIQVKRHINSKAGKRGGVPEVLVVHRGTAHTSEKKFDFSVLGE